MVEEVRDIIAYQQILGHISRFPPQINGVQLFEDRTLECYGVGKEHTMHSVMRLRGGAAPKLAQKMSVAAGGKIKQVIERDTPGSDRLPDKTTVINVQTLNSVSYHSVTGQDPPAKPITAEQYEKYGYPFFKVYEEPTGVSGDFSEIESVAEIDQRTDEPVVPRVVDLGRGDSRVESGLDGGLAHPNGPLCSFRTVADLEKEMAECKIADE